MQSHSVSQVLKRLFRANCRSILLTYGLTLLENSFELLYPLAIGFAIDQLLKGNYSSIIPFLCTWFAHAITAISRHVYDTRTFTSIYSNLATAMVIEQTKQGALTSQVVARSALSREFVDFFERNIPQIIAGLFGFVGALGMLFIYDMQIGLYCLFLLIPLIIINRSYAQKSQGLNHNLNNQLEQEVTILTQPEVEVVRSHYLLLAKWRVYLSNAEALNYGIMELFTILLAATVLVRTTWIPGIQAGEIYAIVSYLWNFLKSLEDIPLLVQQVSRLQDIGQRMHLSSEALNNL
jgi:ABC-type multidrug transport system fused ATPase/permease subunit